LLETFNVDPIAGVLEHSGFLSGQHINSNSYLFDNDKPPFFLYVELQVGYLFQCI